jgi:hypothetical protein
MALHFGKYRRGLETCPCVVEVVTVFAAWGIGTEFFYGRQGMK